MKRIGSSLATNLLLTGCNSRPPETTTESPSAKVIIAADRLVFDDAECREQGLPLAITLRNTGTEASRVVRWFFAINKVGHLDNLTVMDKLMSLGDDNRRTDRIIQPGASYKVCSPVPDLSGYDAASSTLEYHVGTVTD